MAKIIQERSVKCKVEDEKKISKELDVFYNPIMRINRDISVELLKSIEKNDLQIADILAASGIRSIRFIKELPSKKINNILINDANDIAVKRIKENLKLNKIKLSNKIKIATKDANKALLDEKGFDYIEIDPFGSPNPFLDAAAKRLARSGILAITATDTSALSGTFENACKRKYWAKPLRNELMHEIGIRILIRKAQLIGAQYEKALIPIFSYSSMHYMRTFLLCNKSKNTVDEMLKLHRYLLYCNNCMKKIICRENNAKCCNQSMLISGPIWTGELYNKEIAEKTVKNILKHHEMKNDKEILTLIELLKGDIENNTEIGFYDIHKITKKWKMHQIPSFEKIIDECSKLGYKTTRTHFNEHAIKSNIPIEELINIVKINVNYKNVKKIE